MRVACHRPRSGAAAVTLQLGKKLTLVNTADGTRYVLLLKARCDFDR